jgi:hypothetical protein
MVMQAHFQYSSAQTAYTLAEAGVPMEIIKNHEAAKINTAIQILVEADLTLEEIGYMVKTAAIQYHENVLAAASHLDVGKSTLYRNKQDNKLIFD